MGENEKLCVFLWEIIFAVTCGPLFLLSQHLSCRYQPKAGELQNAVNSPFVFLGVSVYARGNYNLIPYHIFFCLQ